MPKKLFLSDFMYIGERHNAGLDFVLKKMVEARRAGKSVVEVTAKEFLIDATLAFIRSDKNFVAHAESVKAEAARWWKANMEIVHKGASVYVSEAQEFSVPQKKYLLAFLDAGHHANTYQEFSNMLHQTIQAVQQSALSVQEQYPLFAAAAVLLTSRQYWAEKETIWKSLLR